MEVNCVDLKEQQLESKTLFPNLFPMASKRVTWIFISTTIETSAIFANLMFWKCFAWFLCTSFSLTRLTNCIACCLLFIRIYVAVIGSGKFFSPTCLILMISGSSYGVFTQFSQFCRRSMSHAERNYWQHRKAKRWKCIINHFHHCNTTTNRWINVVDPPARPLTL